MEIELKKVYRHFKGKYYFIEDIAINSEDESEYVIYRPLYDSSKLWLRKKEMFFDDVSTREDNITGQKTRFEKVKEMEN